MLDLKKVHEFCATIHEGGFKEEKCKACPFYEYELQTDNYHCFLQQHLDLKPFQWDLDWIEKYIEKQYNPISNKERYKKNNKRREEVIRWAVGNGWKLKRPTAEDWPASPLLTKGNIRIALGEEDACFETSDMSFSITANIEDVKISFGKLCFEKGNLTVRPAEDNCLTCGKVAKGKEGSEMRTIHSNRYDLPHLWTRGWICADCIQKEKDDLKKMIALAEDLSKRRENK